MFVFNDDEWVIVEMVVVFVGKCLVLYVLEWDVVKYFLVDVLWEVVEFGMVVIYCCDDVGGSGLCWFDGVCIFEQLVIVDLVIVVFLFIYNMCVWMIDSFGIDE